MIKETSQPNPRESSKPSHRIHVVQGEHCVNDDPDTVLTTILGSCIAACLWDAEKNLGGMNHFLLPGDGINAQDVTGGTPSSRYGVYAMELLVNAMLRRGARRERMQAKLFGGARMIRGLTDVGHLNATFAERFLQNEGIPVVGGSLRGTQGRRVQFWPVGGRARQVLIKDDSDSLFRSEYQSFMTKPPRQAGSIELF
ncbi:chemotaxis protein CheD [Acidisoma sp. C75]